MFRKSGQESPSYTDRVKMEEGMNKPAKVRKTLLDKTKTNRDILFKQVQALFDDSKVENFRDIGELGKEARKKLLKLGVFKYVKIKIDTTKGENASPIDYEVEFLIEDLGIMSGGTQTQIGTNDGNLLFDLKFPNLLCRGEKATIDYTYGTKQSRGLGIHFTKPVNGDTEVLFGLNAYQAFSEYPWSGYRESDRGAGVDLSFPSLIGEHTIKYEGVWRDLRCLSNKTSFAVREQAGHSLKSSLIHSFVRDKRDDTVLPTEGTLLKLTQEYAGIGGNARFFKHDVELQANKSLSMDSVLQLSFAGGIMRPLEPNKEISINDKFFLGGPLTLRGFNMKGVGPHSDGNSLGGDMYCMGAVHLYTPLPFQPGKGGLGDLLRSHFFVNAGNCGSIQGLGYSDFNRNNVDVFRNSLRLAYGAGIVLRLGRVVRVELNYVVPVWMRQGDSSNPGLQLGVGITFL